jgi:hypothetical protein
MCCDEAASPRGLPTFTVDDNLGEDVAGTSNLYDSRDVS